MTEKFIDLDVVKKLREEGFTLRRIALHLHTSKSTITKKWLLAGNPPMRDIRKANSVWLKRRDQMQKMFDDGATMKEVGDVYGVSPSTVAGACDRWNLTVITAAKKKRLSIAARQNGLASAIARGQKLNSSRANGGIAILKKRVEAPPPKPETVCDIMGLGLGRCRFMVPDIESRPGGLYCGDATETELSSWCPYHASIVHGLLGQVGEAPRSGDTTKQRAESSVAPHSNDSAHHSRSTELENA